MFFPFIVKWYSQWEHRQKRISKGNDYPDKTFYIIGCNDTNGGLFWLINKVLMHIAYANDNNYIPVVDLQNYKTQYTCDETYGIINVWELFFKQPAGVSLSDIAHARNIIINRQEPAPMKKYLMGQSSFYDCPHKIMFYKNLFNEYIHFNKKTEEYLNNVKREIIGDRTNIIGVLCRGTDYVLLRPKGHPIQPSPSQVINDVKELMNLYDSHYVFLATEDADILKQFQDTFGEGLLFINQPRIYKKDINANEMLSETKQRLMTKTDSWLSGVQYLAAIWLLTQCDHFIGGRTGGTKGVLLMSKGFISEKIYNLGMY